MMKKNENYEKGKKIVNDANDYFTQLYEYYSKFVEDYENEVMPHTEKYNEEYAIGKKFCLLMIVMNELSPNEKNLILLHNEIKKPEKTLEVFNGIGGDYRNKATLSSMLTHVKKKIRAKVKEKEQNDDEHDI